jgi:tetratricopeptide (TPR) repeat protein
MKMPCVSSPPVHPDSDHPEGTIRKLAIEAVALYPSATVVRWQIKDLTQAESLCKSQQTMQPAATCSGRAASWPSNRGNSPLRGSIFSKVFSLLGPIMTRLLEASASMNLGWAALQINHFDEAVDWSRSAYRAAVELGAENTAQIAVRQSRLGLLPVGRRRKGAGAVSRSGEERRKTRKYPLRTQMDQYAGYVYHDTGDSARAAQSYRQALYLAKQIDSKEDIVNALEDLAQVSVETGKLDEASSYIDQVTPMERLRAAIG